MSIALPLIELAARSVAALSYGDGVGNARRLLLTELINALVPGTGRAIALLWITDRAGERRYTTAWAVSWRPKDAYSETQLQLLRFSTSKVNKNARDAMEHWNSMLSLAANQPEAPCPVYRQLETLRSGLSHELLIPLICKNSETDEEELLGIIQLLSATAITQVDTDTQTSLGSIIANVISFDRRRRAIRAIEVLQDTLKGLSRELDVCKAAATVMQTFASAERCTIYRRTKNSELEVCADTHSLIRPRSLPLSSFGGAVFQLPISQGKGRIIRLIDSRNRDELFTLPEMENVPILVEEIGGDLRGPVSVMFAQVVCPASLPDVHAPLLLCRLTARPHSSFIGGGFSQNDETIVRAVTTYLGQILPGLILQERSEILSGIRINASSPRASIVNESTEDIFQVFPRAAFDKIPSIEAAWAVIARATDSDPLWIAHDGSHGRPIDAPPVIWDQFAREQRLWSKPYLFEKVLTQGFEKFALAVRTSADPMASHDEITLRLIASEMRLRAIGRLDVSEMIRQVAEFRHAMRSSLTGVLGHVGNLQDMYGYAASLPRELVGKLLTGQAAFRKSMDDAIVSADQMQRFFEDSRIVFLDLSRSELRLARTNIASVVREIRRTMQSTIGQRELTINVQDNYPRSVLDPNVDRTLIQIAIANILDNAIKYSHRGNSIDVEIGISRARWYIAISDIGRYIPPEERKRIFEQFVRLRTARGEQAMPGTGLGLPAAQRIVTIHDPKAEIKVDSVLMSAPPVQKAKTTFRIEMNRELSGGDG